MSDERKSTPGAFAADKEFQPIGAGSDKKSGATVLPFKEKPAVAKLVPEEIKNYTYDEALAMSLAYFDGDELAAKVFVDKYALRSGDGTLTESNPDQMHRRMAKEFGKAERKLTSVRLEHKKELSKYGQQREYLSIEKIYDMFKGFGYVVPQGSVMAILGNDNVVGSLSNCFVLPEMSDSYGGILYADQQLVQLQKRRGGTGLDLSSLRPEGTRVNNAALTSTGLVSFMERFSNTTREVAQGGRRGASMLTCDIAHPDVEKFITIKQDLKKVTGANISVRLSDEFMQAVKDDKEYTHRWPIEAPLEKAKYTKTIKARDLWEVIIKCAHNTAEPGLIFWDRQHWYSPSSVYPFFKNLSTNPCSEIAMQGGDSCRLMALNLYGFVDKPFAPDASFNYEKFYETTYESQRLMDDLVELELEAVGKIISKIESDPEPESVKRVELETWHKIRESGAKGRRTGLGFTAMADAMAALGFRYDSEEGTKFVEEMMRTKLRAEFDSSVDMAVERGRFDGFDPKIEQTSQFIAMMQKEFNEVYSRMMRHGRRNVSISTVAPTGTLSLLTQTSSGLEPVFMLSYKRRKKITHNEKDVKSDFTDAMGDKWQEFTVYHPKLKKWMEVTGETDETKSPYYGSTANEIDWHRRIEIQSVLQKYTTHSLSSTVNLPGDVAVEKVGDIYMEAWERGLKGITVYRDGSRSGVLVSNDKKEDKIAQAYGDHNAPKRPRFMPADVIRFNNGGERWIGFVGLYEGRPYEVFTGKAENFKVPSHVEKGRIRKTKTDEGSKYDFLYEDKDGEKVVGEWLNRAFNEYHDIAKLISGIIRHGMPLPYVVDLVSSLRMESDLITTWKAGVARMIKQYIPDGTTAADKNCKDCGSASVIYQEGCMVCTSCGSSKCG